MATSSTLCAALELPDELFGMIVVKLPLFCLFQLRVVCKQWNALLHDTRFLEKHFQPARRAPLFVRPTEEGFVAYSPETNSWDIWPESFLLMGKSRRAVSGGVNGWLLLGENDDEKSPYIANPMIRFSKGMSRSPVHPIGLVFDENSKSHKIFGGMYVFFGTLDDMPYRLLVYDSEVESWKIIGEWEDSIFFHLPTFHQCALHCLITELDVLRNREAAVRAERNQRGPRIHRVFRYDGGQSWHQLTAGQIPLDLLFVEMFNWEGNLMLVGGSGIEDSVSSVKVWQLDVKRSIWMESMTMPDCLLRRFSPWDPHWSTNFRCYTGADYIYLYSYCMTLNFEHAKSVLLVICDLRKKLWWEAPEPSSIFKQSGKNLWSEPSPSVNHRPTFLFKPSFDEIE